MPIDLSSLKSSAKAERAALLEKLRVRPSGVEGARLLTRQRDALLARVFAEADPPARLALAAVGGYGREQLAPGSDTDVALIHADRADEQDAGAFATRFFQTLWDLGLELGHAVRSLEDAARTLTRDLPSATALIDARLIAGDPGVFVRFDVSRKDFLERYGEEFLKAKCAEADARHAKHGPSIFRAEPNVKESPGALRDLELLRLFMRVPGSPRSDSPFGLGGIPLLDDEAHFDLDDAEERLLTTRLLMHLHEGKKADRLAFDVGPRVAAAFGFRDSRDASAVEAFMSDYYKSSKAVDRALRLARHALERRIAARADHAPEHRPRRIADKFVALAHEIELARPDVFESSPDCSPAMELFLEAQREKLDIAEPTIEAVRKILPRMNEGERESSRLALLFRKLLAGRTRVASTLRAMHRASLLGEYLPEFGTLDGLWQQDPYHEYTVDEHSIRCVEALEGFAESREREDQLRAEILGRVERSDILRLGVLLHDMGKGKGGAHVEVGTAMVPEVVRRMGLTVEEGRILRFLVEQHLWMSKTIEQRDFSSPETLAKFCEVVGDEERLELLYLLTAADMRGVGGHAFPRWKDALLTSLYQMARDRFRGGERHAIHTEERRAEILARLPEGVTAADLDKHLDLAPKRYQLEVEPFDVVVHLRLIRDLERGQNPTTAHVVDGALRYFWVCTRDRPGLFASIAGVLAARGASILSADAYTRRDGVILDKLTLAISQELADDETYWEGLDNLLTDVIGGRKKVEDVVAAARSRVPYRETPKAPPRPTVIKVSNKLSDRYTVLDIGIEDRVGLLYDIAHKLTELGLDIHYSKISTRANRAADVFYVTRDGAKVEDPAELEKVQSALGEL